MEVLKENGNDEYYDNSKSIEIFISGLAKVKPQRFTHGQLMSYTSDFKSQIGSGGFADVYKGQLPDSGLGIAVKVLKNGVGDVMEMQFMAEVSTMAKTSHRNLLKLFGFCFDAKMKALVYEYMENGSLDKILYENHLRVEWETLYNIAIKTAKALSYLHEYCEDIIIHYDIKAANVLLDSNLDPKVADFGLAKLCNKDLSRVAQSGFRGTRGYAAPEVWMGFEEISCKCDIFSFGMMLFEVLGRKRLNEGEVWFPGHIWKNFQEGQLDEIIMGCGIGENDKEKAKTLSIVALWCIQFNPRDRPRMSTVVKVLEGEIHLMSPPNPFPYYDFSSASSMSSGSSCITTQGPPLPPASSIVSLTFDRRLEEKLSKLEAESQVLRQQALAIPSTTTTRGPPLPTAPSIVELEEKLSNLEAENQVLRQQALVIHGTSKTLSAEPKLTIYQDLTPAISSLQEPESKERPHKSVYENYQENQDLLIKCIAEDLGFSGRRPVAACIIYKCLLHWRLFEVQRTNVFDRIIQTIASSIEVEENNDTLSYWLSNTSTLLLLLQRTLKASGAASLTPQRSTSLFGRMSQALQGSLQSAGLSFLNGQMLAGLDDVRQVEATYPALLFKQQLTAFVEKIYGMIRDKLKKEISPMLGLCIQAPRTMRASLVKRSHSLANAHAQQALMAHWQSIVKMLNNYLKTLRGNYVPPFLVRKVFTQIFTFVNVHLFNSLLLRRECCSFLHGEFVKSGLAELELWCVDATEEYAGSAWDELKRIRQAVGFLVMHKKPRMTFNEITKDICPGLSIQQLYRISTMYWDDKYGTHSVSPDVISSMRIHMTEYSNNDAGSDFLLYDEDLSLPFSVDDISKSVQQIDIAGIDPPALVRGNPEFVFLFQQAE